MSNTASSTITIAQPRASAPLLVHPEGVLRNPGLTVAEKREVLARWASDAHAVEDAPALRRLDNGTTVSVDDILRALKALDGGDESATARARFRRAFNRKRGGLLSRLRVRRKRDDRDDDPPPRPANAAYPVRIPVVDALAA